MQFSAQVNLWNGGEGSKTLGFATLFIQAGADSRIAIDGFTIVNGKNGPFVGFPQGKPYEKDGKQVYPRTTRFLEQREEGSNKPGALEQAAQDAILAAYAEASGGSARAAAATSQTAQPTRTGTRPPNPRQSAAGW